MNSSVAAAVPAELVGKFFQDTAQQIPLWYSGSIELLNTPMVAVVGKRHASELGKRRAEEIAKTLVALGFTVVSGLADGIDTVAHQTTLSLGGCAVAVLGTSIDQCFPKHNSRLKSEIEKAGLVISQFPPHSKTYRSNFPKRNALMARLSCATIIVEADACSGTRHQVLTAIKLGKKIGFLASVVEQGHAWVNRALSLGAATTISDHADLRSLLSPSGTAHRS